MTGISLSCSTPYSSGVTTITGTGDSTRVKKIRSCFLVPLAMAGTTNSPKKSTSHSFSCFNLFQESAETVFRWSGISSGLCFSIYSCISVTQTCLATSGANSTLGSISARPLMFEMLDSTEQFPFAWFLGPGLRFIKLCL